MTTNSCRAGLFALLSFTMALTALAAVNEAPSHRAKLAVLIVFDQLRGDYLSRWDSLFDDGGFRRLMRDGAWFRNCHYPYSNTVTGAGHASLATGCLPRDHGIVGNDWFERPTGDIVYCATSSRYQNVPESKAARSRDGGSPERLLVAGLADALKSATNGASRVVSMSLKDRGAILLAGKKPDACYWFDASSGQFQTSTYYRGQPHAWVETFNNRHSADRWFDKTWNPMRDDIDYDRWSGPDDAAGEGKGVVGRDKVPQGRTFPHSLTMGLDTAGRSYWEALYNSPFGNDLLLAFAESAIDAEELGRHATPDLLCISFSSNDAIGHTWGPDSHEVLDVTLRSDRLMRELLEFLDRKVGKGQYSIVLSSDHGVCPLPEVSRKQGIDARRVPLEPIVRGAEEHLAAKFPQSKLPPLERSQGGILCKDQSLFLNRTWLEEGKVERKEAERTLAAGLRARPEIVAAYTGSELSSATPPADDIGKRVWGSYRAGRSGDVTFVLKQYYLLGSELATGTTHGTPHAYDTRVPLLVYGPGVRAGAREDAVTPQAAVPMLARTLRISVPETCKASVPEGVMRGD